MTNVILKELYPLVVQSYEINKNKLQQCVGRFIDARQSKLYAIAPYDRIYFGKEDEDDFFNSINIESKKVEDIINKTYYSKIKNFNPRAAKCPFVCCLMCLLRYFNIKKLYKELDIYTGYLSFSGSFYPSIHFGSYPKVQPSEYPYIMDYVVNNCLSGRYDLKKQGNIFKAIRSVAKTWNDSYGYKFKDFEDDDVVYLIQQLRDRIKSFMQNIAEVYYDIYKRKDTYFTYDGDSLDDNNYHLADNDSLLSDRIIEKTITYINTNRPNYQWCLLSQDKRNLVKADEIQEIITSIINDPINIPDIREFIRCIVSVFMHQSKTKDIKQYEFLKISVVPKPNSKDPLEIKKMKIVEKWLNENSPLYRKRRNRAATESAYKKAIISYFSLCIYNVNK